MYANDERSQYAMLHAYISALKQRNHACVLESEQVLIENKDGAATNETQ